MFPREALNKRRLTLVWQKVYERLSGHFLSPTKRAADVIPQWSIARPADRRLVR